LLRIKYTTFEKKIRYKRKREDLKIEPSNLLKDVEDTLAEQLKNLDKKTVKLVCLYHWIKEVL